MDRPRRRDVTSTTESLQAARHVRTARPIWRRFHVRSSAVTTVEAWAIFLASSVPPRTSRAQTCHARIVRRRSTSASIILTARMAPPTDIAPSLSRVLSAATVCHHVRNARSTLFIDHRLSMRSTVDDPPTAPSSAARIARVASTHCRRARRCIAHPWSLTVRSQPTSSDRTFDRFASISRIAACHVSHPLARCRLSKRFINRATVCFTAFRFVSVARAARVCSSHTRTASRVFVCVHRATLTAMHRARRDCSRSRWQSMSQAFFHVCRATLSDPCIMPLMIFAIVRRTRSLASSSPALEYISTSARACSDSARSCPNSVRTSSSSLLRAAFSSLQRCISPTAPALPASPAFAAASRARSWSRARITKSRNDTNARAWAAFRTR